MTFTGNFETHNLCDVTRLELHLAIVYVYTQGYIIRSETCSVHLSGVTWGFTRW